MPESPPASLNGVKMHVITTAANGVVGRETIFDFHQEGRVVTAPYRGGKIMTGYLAGVWEGDLLHFRYVQVTADQVVQGGSSTARISRSAAGRLRLEENSQWDTAGGAGTNIFEEI
ncbi:hypothetical protein [Opitutus sp. GAS368]|uniref:hypothetical protein n=1 Tax=Opitutus sp. GAS368 TaxID=1882749 RepID=UPI00087955BD|nr:hypothetical protein [Opitutus sp. GAS368]SDR99458.1 hypothetical protein SAMN05444173_1563 [Opitutus sp. GAS368]